MKRVLTGLGIMRLYRKFRNLILYGIIGCFSSGVDFLIYTLLVQIVGMWYVAANCMSVIAGIVMSFTLNRKYNFKVKDKTSRRFAIFLTVGLCGMVMSNIILFVGIDILDIDKLITKLLSIVLVVFGQFLLNKYITFKTR